MKSHGSLQGLSLEENNISESGAEVAVAGVMLCAWGRVAVWWMEDWGLIVIGRLVAVAPSL